MSDTVLITGGSGFIGSYLALQLINRGDRVVNLDLRPHAGPMAWLIAPCLSQIAFEEGQVENWPQLLAVLQRHKVNKIAHLASPIDTDYVSRHPKLAYDVIITGVVNVLEAARLLGVERLIYFSSIGVLPTRQYEPIDCNHPTLMAGEGPGTGAYGAGKIAGEALCWAYRQSYGVDFVALRPSAAYGFTTRNLIYLNQMVEGALRGEAVHFTHGGSLPRDYTHVEDIAGIAAAALQVPASNLKHRVFYAASGQPLLTAGRIAEIVREMLPGADVSIQPELDSGDSIEVNFRGLLDVSPVSEQLGYQIRFTNIRAGIADLVERYSAYLASQGKTVAVGMRR